MLTTDVSLKKSTRTHKNQHNCSVPAVWRGYLSNTSGDRKPGVPARGAL